jgi:hypothetical protein
VTSSSTLSTLNFTNATGSAIYASTIRAATFCLTGDSCITSWPVGGAASGLQAVTNVGSYTTTSLSFFGGATSSNFTTTGTLAALGDIRNTFTSTTPALTQVATVPSPADDMTDIAIQGRFAYVALAAAGAVGIYEISNPEVPVFVTVWRPEAAPPTGQLEMQESPVRQKVAARMVEA